MVKVDRYVCGECNDFKIVVKLTMDKFDVSGHGKCCLHSEFRETFARCNTVSCCPARQDWEKVNFAPEKDFLADAIKVPSVTAIETQTMTSEEM